MHVETRTMCKSLQINSAPRPWATAVQVCEERSKGRNRSERTISMLTTALPSVGLLDTVCVLTGHGLCTGSDCGQSPIGSEKHLIAQAMLPVHLLDYFLWRSLHTGSESPSTNKSLSLSLCFTKKPCGWVVALKIVQ